MKYKYIVALLGTNLDAEEDELDLTGVRGFTSKKKAEAAVASFVDGRTNMDVMLLKVERNQRGFLTMKSARR